MLTNALFYRDPYCAVFTAVVTGCQEVKGGFAVTLSDTAFYPEGGGQACDLGTLNGINVLDVREKDDQVIHLCQKPLAVGETAEGRILWDRRFDLMQQHTGEHMVSGIIHSRYGYHNVGFHMGSELVTIDFDGMIPAEALPEIEEEVNRRIWQNLPVTCSFPSEEELAHIPYRTKKLLPWPVRLVEIPGTDTCACCGTHVAHTAEVGLVKLFSCVKFHQGVRIEMACGRRALDYLSRVHQQNKLVSQAFSAKPLETGEAAEKINQQLSDLKFRLVGLQRQVFSAIAESYAGKELAFHHDPQLEPGQLRLLCEILVQKCPLAVAMGDGGSICIGGEPQKVNALGAALRKSFGARGGGKPGFFQGNIPAEPEAVKAFLTAQM